MSAKRKARKLLMLLVVIAVLLEWNGAATQNDHIHERTEEPRVTLSGSPSASGSNVVARQIKNHFGSPNFYVPGPNDQPVYSLAIPFGVTFGGTIDENAPSWKVKL